MTGRTVIELIIATALIVVASVAGANSIESPINIDVSTNVDVVSHGLETVYAYRYGESTILIVVVNPNVLFSYRNIHVVPWKDGFYYEQVSQSSPSIATLYRRLNAVRERLLASGLGDLDLRVEGLLYVANLSGKPIDRIARAIGEVFGDLNVTVVVLDKRLFDLRQLYVDSGLVKFFREIPDLNSDYWRTLNKTVESLVTDLVNSSCFCHLCFHGITTSRIDGFEYPHLLDMSISATYEKCREIIERHVVELADSIRRYIPEDIPLYISIYEKPSICGIVRGPEIITQIPIEEHINLDSETQGGHALLYIATILPAPVLGVVAYFMIKRLRK